MKTSSYPPGCNAVPDDEARWHDFTERFTREYGRVGHGLCGKDADLDPGGQIRVEFAGWSEDVAEAQVHVYANICCPEGAEAADMATELVSTCEYPGEWTGSDYWTMYPCEGLHTVRCAYVDLDGVFSKQDEDAAMEALSKAIFADPVIVEFRREMADLAQTVDKLTEERDNV